MKFKLRQEEGTHLVFLDDAIFVQVQLFVLSLKLLVVDLLDTCLGHEVIHEGSGLLSIELTALILVKLAPDIIEYLLQVRLGIKRLSRPLNRPPGIPHELWVDACLREISLPLRLLYAVPVGFLVLVVIRVVL